ncbi:MAG: hypothetical protein IPN63_07520 [Gammaproteobacteria bacterium]|nr:hypothetical protein [Gammaproteobacteria bacterium]
MDHKRQHKQRIARRDIALCPAIAITATWHHRRIGFGTAASPAVAPDVSAAATDDTLIALFSAGDQTVGSTPSGMTQRFLSDQSLTSLGIYDEALSASGATGSRTWTGSGSGTGASIVIRASAAAGRIRMMV